MGVGAAVIFPTTLGLITNIFTDPVPRAKAIGLWAAMVGVGVAVGPISGGWLLEHFWWGSIFMVNIPIAVVAIVGGILFVPDLPRPRRAACRRPRLDPVRGRNHRAWSTPSSKRPRWGWTSTRAATGFTMAAIVLAGFALWERRSTHPDAGRLGVLQPSVLRRQPGSDRGLSDAVRIHLRHHPVLPIHQELHRISRPVCGCCRSPSRSRWPASWAPDWSNEIGTTAVVAGGLAVFAAGLAWASTADAATPYSQIAMQMLLLGGGLGLTIAPATEAIMGSLSADKAGVGSAVNDTTRELGGTLGVAIAGSIFASVYSGHLGAAAALTGLPAERDAATQWLWRTR